MLFSSVSPMLKSLIGVTLRGLKTHSGSKKRFRVTGKKLIKRFFFLFFVLFINYGKIIVEGPHIVHITLGRRHQIR